MKEPELQSIEAFIKYLHEDERKTFTLVDCQDLGECIHMSNSKIRAILEYHAKQETCPHTNVRGEGQYRLCSDCKKSWNDWRNIDE